MYWDNQYSVYIIGSAVVGDTLTDAYAGNTSTDDVRGHKVAVLYVEYTPAENTSDAYIQIEAGPDEATLFPKTALLDIDTSGESSVKGHVFKLEAVTGGTPVKSRIIVDLADVKLRVSAKEVTSGSYGTMKILLGRCEQFGK